MAKVPKEHWTKSRLLRVPQLPARVSSHQERIDALFQKPVDDEFASVLSAILTQITKRPITVKVIKPPESHYEIAVSSPKTATERPIKFSYRISQVFEEFNSAKDLPCSECGLPRDFARQPNGFPDMNLACCKNGHEVRNLVLNREIGQAHVAAQVITCQFAASTNPKARVNQRASVSKAILDEDGNTRLVASVNGEFSSDHQRMGKTSLR